MLIVLSVSMHNCVNYQHINLCYQAWLLHSK